MRLALRDCALWLGLGLCTLRALSALPDPNVDNRLRVKRQEPERVPDAQSEEYGVDYAGNDNNDDPPADNNEDPAENIDDPADNNDDPGDTFKDTQTDFNDKYGQNDDFNEDKFGQTDFNKDDFGNNNDVNEDKFNTDNFNDSPKEDKKSSQESAESKPKKKAKKHKYLKKTFEFLKRVLDPNKLMENAYVTEMLRRFSHKDDSESVSKELTEEVQEIHTPPPMRSRRGRPRKKDRIPPGITGLIKKGMMSLTKMELDKKKLRRRVRLIKRIARKAKKPLKTAVKIFLSSRNQGMGGGYGGGGGFGNNNY